MASSSAQADDGFTPAQRLMAQHAAAESRQPTIEDVVDEEDVAHPPPVSESSNPAPQPPATNDMTMSARAAGKQRASESDAEPSLNEAVSRKQRTPAFDATSEDTFPSLAAPKPSGPSAGKWSSKPAAVSANGNAPSVPTHLKMPMGAGRGVNLPGQASNSMTIQTRLLAPQRGCQYKTMPELLKAVNKKFRVNVQTTTADGKTNFHATGPTPDSCSKALKEIAALWGAQQTVEVMVPTALLSQIIGKQGVKIKELQERTGARIHTNRSPKTPNEDGSEESKIEIQGNPVTGEAARRELQTILKNHTPTFNMKISDIPPELYPFLAGAHNSRIAALEEGHDVRVKVPQYHKSHTSTIPKDVASFAPHGAYHISVQGEREAAKRVQMELRRHAEDLRRSLMIQHLDVECEKHRFILDGEKSLHNFLERTGCTVVMPASGSDTETIAVIGPQEHVQAALDHAMDLALSMHTTNVDVSRQHQNIPNAQAHAQDIARYLQHRHALRSLEEAHDASIIVPEGPGAWQIYSRDGKNGMRARADITNVVGAHPPTRFRSLKVHPFYQQHIQNDHAHLVRDRYGVHLVFDNSSAEVAEPSPLLLVYEGTPQEASGKFDPPRAKPSEEDAVLFQKRLAEAETYLKGLLDPATDIVSDSIDAPSKYQDKLRRHVDAQARQSQTQYPVQFMGFGSSSQGVPTAQESVPMQFRGPAPDVGAYRQSLLDFIEEQIRDEAERDFTTTCDFPQKHANQLIGRKGENINRLRQEHDVEIQINDGKVEIKGPERKANKAKTDILALARRADDETTLIVKMKPQFHGSIIGSGGGTPRRLQERYKVQISFPKTRDSSDTHADGGSDAGGPNRPKRPAQAADEVLIRGPTKGASEARKELEELYDYVVKNSYAATVSVAQSLLPSLIGSRGKELESLRLETGAKIDVPGSKGDADPSGRVPIEIKGTKEQVEKAKKAIEARAKVYDDSVRRTMNVDKKHHRALIGRNGENILDLVTKAGGSPEERTRLVRFPPADSQDNTIQFDGNASVVDELAAAIEAFVLNRDQQVTETIHIPPDRHGALIGTGGEMRKRLETEFKISISIPDRNLTGTARSAVKISGLPADVERAKEHITEMTKGQESERVDVPLHMHHAIFGPNLSRFRELNVKIDHAGHARPPRPNPSTARPNGAGISSMPLITDQTDRASMDVNEHHSWDIVEPTQTNGAQTSTIPWVLKSPDPNSVVEARELIEAAIAAQSRAATGYLFLPDPSMNQYVIGPRGSTINGIRADTGCDIDVPKRGGTSEVIAITGDRDAIETAKNMIIDAVSNGLSR